MTRVFIGDIQGCFEELRRLLEKIDFSPSRMELCCVGDLVNRGPQSLEVLRFLKKVDATAVLGNHDLHLLDRYFGDGKKKKRDTLESILKAKDVDDLMDWLRLRPLLVEWDDLIMVHAALPKKVPSEKRLSQLEEKIANGKVPWKDSLLKFLVTARLLDSHLEMAKGYVETDELKAWDKFLSVDKRVVCGHWATRGLYQTKDVISLDTGCVWGGELTAWIEETNEFVSVDALQSYQS